jgi:hypothetical protein
VHQPGDVRADLDERSEVLEPYNFAFNNGSWLD